MRARKNAFFCTFTRNCFLWIFVFRREGYPTHSRKSHIEGHRKREAKGTFCDGLTRHLFGKQLPLENDENAEYMGIFNFGEEAVPCFLNQIPHYNALFL